MLISAPAPRSQAPFVDSTSQTVLDFLGMMVTIWLVLVECKETASKQDCILALGDNTSTIGWFYNSGELPFDSPCHLAIQLIA
jgi:hypothetical protein